MQAVRILNTHCSCDTLSLSLNGNRQDWLHHLEVIAGGKFLTARPSDRALKNHLWEEVEVTTFMWYV